MQINGWPMGSPWAIVDTDGRLWVNSLSSQNIIADESNSSTTNIPFGGSYVGSPASTLNIVGIQTSLKTDQNCAVYVDQSPDGINWDINDMYNYYASINNFGVTTQAINSYHRVRVVNTGNSGTTYFRLQTALCPVVEAVPRSLDSDGNFKVGIKSTSDVYGFNVENTPMGEMRVVEPVRLVGATFTSGTIDSNFWTSTTTSGATNTQLNSQIILNTGSTPNASATLQSSRNARYVGAAVNRFRSILRVPDNTANNIKRWGAYDGTNGAFFQVSGTTFGVGLLKGGSETIINTGSFNGNLGGIYNPGSIVRTNEIYWTNSKVWFVVGDEILHTYSANYDTWTNTLNLPIRAENYNLNNGSDSAALNLRVATISRLGKLETQPISRWQSGQISGLVLKLGPGNLHGINITAVTQNANITLTDNTTSGGGIIFSTGAMGAQAQPFNLDFHSIPFYSGLTLTIGGANANAMVMYE